MAFHAHTRRILKVSLSVEPRIDAGRYQVKWFTNDPPQPGGTDATVDANVLFTVARNHVLSVA
jgi:hypothetical protein